MKSPKQIFDRFRRTEDGTATVEFLLWMPIMASLLMLTADFTLLMNQQTLLYDAARDSSRMVASGQKSASEAETSTLTRLGSEKSYAATVSASGGYVTSVVTVPFNDVLIFGRTLIGTNIMGGSLQGRAVMWIETAGT